MGRKKKPETSAAAGSGISPTGSTGAHAGAAASGNAAASDGIEDAAADLAAELSPEEIEEAARQAREFGALVEEVDEAVAWFNSSPGLQREQLWSLGALCAEALCGIPRSHGLHTWQRSFLSTILKKLKLDASACVPFSVRACCPL